MNSERSRTVDTGRVLIAIVPSGLLDRGRISGARPQRLGCLTFLKKSPFFSSLLVRQWHE
jgi:hypothetical protein